MVRVTKKHEVEWQWVKGQGKIKVRGERLRVKGQGLKVKGEKSRKTAVGSKYNVAKGDRNAISAKKVKLPTPWL